MGCHWNECLVGPVPLVIGPGIGISTGWGRVVVGSASAERDALYLPDQGKKAYFRTGRSRTTPSLFPCSYGQPLDG